MADYTLSRAARRIRQLRKQHHLNQTQVAKVMNVAQRTYSDYERGRTQLNIVHLLTLAKFYDVSVDYICGVRNERLPFPRK